MRVSWGGLFAIALAASMTVASRGGGDFKVEAGYVSLFNGKDLTGWKYYKETDLAGKTETADKRFRVANGIIIAEEGKGIKDLYTATAYNKEFNLKLEFHAALKADSGVYVRGPQLQVRDFVRRNEMKHFKKFKNDDWNELDITVRHNVAVAKVNGKAVSDKDDVEVSVKGGKPSATLNGKPIEFGKVEVSVGSVAHCLCNGEFMENMVVPLKSAQGIGLQAETGKFEFRRVRIKEMP